METVQPSAGGIHVRVRVQPKASRNSLRIEADGAIRVSLTAPPVEGQANKALIAFAAKTFGVPRRAIRILHGERGRDKVLAVEGVSVPEALCILSGDESSS